MKADLKFLVSPDLDDLEADTPPDSTDFRVLIQAMVGDTESDASESFNFLVCTPTWLQKRVARDGHLWARHHLIVQRYDYKTIEGLIRNLCDSVEGDDWDQIAKIMARHGAWEFEDYED